MNNLLIVFSLTRGLGLVTKRNFVEFLVDFQELENLETMSIGRVLGSCFQMGYGTAMPYEFLAGFQKIETHLRTCDDCHVSTFGSRRDIVGDSLAEK